MLLPALSSQTMLWYVLSQTYKSFVYPPSAFQCQRLVAVRLETNSFAQACLLLPDSDGLTRFQMYSNMRG